MLHMYVAYVKRKGSAVDMQEKDKKNNTIPLLLSDNEVKEIDDWRFKQHIGSRNEAIRQLIKKGLVSSKK